MSNPDLRQPSNQESNGSSENISFKVKLKCKSLKQPLNTLRPEQIDGFVFLMTSKIQDQNLCYNHNFKNLLYMLFFNDASY